MQIVVFANLMIKKTSLSICSKKARIHTPTSLDGLSHLLSRFASRLDICICLFHNQTAILSGHVQVISVAPAVENAWITAPAKGARAFSTRVFLTSRYNQGGETERIPLLYTT